MAHNLTRRHLLQIELHAARQHSHRDFLRISCRKNELDVRWRLFQCLEHGVERMIAQHMDFIDHVDLEARIGRCIHRLLKQLRHFVDATIRCGVHLDVIDKTPGINCYTGLAHAARMRGDVAATIRTLTIQCFGENAR